MNTIRRTGIFVIVCFTSMLTAAIAAPAAFAMTLPPDGAEGASLGSARAASSGMAVWELVLIIAGAVALCILMLAAAGLRRNRASSRRRVQPAAR